MKTCSKHAGQARPLVARSLSRGRNNGAVSGFTVDSKNELTKAPSSKIRARNALAVPEDPRPIRRSGVYRWIALLLIIGSLTPICASGRPLSVMVLPMVNEAPSASESHWQLSIQYLIAGRLRSKELMLIPRETIEYGFNRLALSKTNSLSPRQVTEFGKFAEADRVVWGTYRCNDRHFTLKLRTLKVRSEKASAEVTFSGTNWSSIVDEAATCWSPCGIRIGLPPTLPRRLKRLAEPWRLSRCEEAPTQTPWLNWRKLFGWIPTRDWRAKLWPITIAWSAAASKRRCLRKRF